MYPLYPIIKPYRTHQLQVDKPHVLYLEETGNPEGLPIILLHDGPGAGNDPHLRRLFDPELYHIIYFDQRGCGHSLPSLELNHNTSAFLVDDIQSICTYLDLKKVCLFGSGFGALLALLYTMQVPQNVLGLLLHGLFLGRKQDIHWLYQQGASAVYPDYWQEFTATIPSDNKRSIPFYYEQCLQGNNELARMAAAKSWLLWRQHCSHFQSQNLSDESFDPHLALTIATLESHYINRHFFLKENSLFRTLNRLKNVPIHFIHGRYDMISPLACAWELHQRMPHSNLSIVREAGHSLYEPVMIDALITLSKQFSHVVFDEDS